MVGFTARFVWSCFVMQISNINIIIQINRRGIQIRENSTGWLKGQSDKFTKAFIESRLEI